MDDNISEFFRDLNQDIIYAGTAGGKMKEDAFFELYTDELIDAGEITTADYCPYSGRSGRTTVRVDGYGGDPIESQDRTLTLIINDYSDSQEMETMDTARLAQFLANLNRFLLSVPTGRYKKELDPHSQIYELMDLIDARWDDIQKIRMLLITNRVFSERANLENAIDRIGGGQLGGKDLAYTARDLRWLQKKIEGGSAPVEMTVDLVNDFGGAIPCLPAHVTGSEYESYLAVVPGEKLAAIYDRWTDRLLERNVRVYLSAKGKVNQGIRNTLRSEPEMFFAYNNGLTATAEDVEVRRTADGMEIVGMTNFQIVNGGQTTGSIFNASRDKDSNLENVFVQMKLSVIPEDMTNDVVPKISQYANSQNAVNAADFSANHPFHVAMENCSRNTLVPAADNTFLRTKWFYERARGQYVDAQAKLTQAQRRAFQQEYPKSQKFVKTDLAKYMGVWEGKPHIVCRGAQKNFVDFSQSIVKEWNRQSEQFNERYFRHATAKAILFKETEKIVETQPWYETGGYRAPIVAYAIAKLAHDLEEEVIGDGSHINFDDIWREQELFPTVRKALAISATAIKDVIMNPSAGGSRNVTEWAKQAACWEKVKELSVNWNDDLEDYLIDDDMEQERRERAFHAQKALNNNAASKRANGTSHETWLELKSWMVETGSWGSNPTFDRSLQKLCDSGTLTEHQSRSFISTLDDLKSTGCPIDLP